MAGSDGADTEFWGTREELLLASAVGRHGTRSWDSVAMEVQARIPSPCPLSPQTCRRRYRNIQRRFAADARRIDGGGEPPEPDAIPLLEALRRLRVAELRREVERYDVSIMSLQLRVRRLEEDRERSPQEEQSGNDRPDPSGSEGAKKEADPPAASPENLAVDQVRGGDSGRSCNHSNSVTAARDAAVRVGNGADRADPVVGDDARVFAGEGSYNGSSDTVAKGAEAGTPAGEAAAGAAARTSPARRPDAGESGESVAESKGEAAKESSDVQSSASLSRRRRGRRKAAAASGGSSVGDEADADADEVSPASSRGVGESQPLASLLEIIRSHEYGSQFERRLQSQECARYRRLIRRHVDLATVRHRLAEGAYAADVEFYRDLLLLFTNAVVFFPTSSTEYIAAVQLRPLVRRQMAQTTTLKPAPSSPAAVEEPVAPPPPPPAAPEPETDPDPQGPGPGPSPPLDGTSSAPPLVACRKRSSISGKAPAGDAAEVEVEEEEEDKPDTEKEVVEVVEKKRSAVTGSKGLRTNKARGSSCGGGNRSATDGVAEAAIPVAKRRSAVSFLTRMNKGPAGSPNGTLLQTLKASSGSAGKGGGGSERRRKRRSRLEGRRKPQASRAASAASGGTPGKQPREQGVPPKRGVGRPPKRPPPPLPPPPAKRGKAVEVATPPPPARAAAVKKRARR